MSEQGEAYMAARAAREDWWWHVQLQTAAQDSMLRGDRARFLELINQARRMWALCCSAGHDFDSFEDIERRWWQRRRRDRTCHTCGIAEKAATRPSRPWPTLTP